jgi:hypothetical protein
MTTLILSCRPLDRRKLPKPFDPNGLRRWLVLLLRWWLELSHEGLVVSPIGLAYAYYDVGRARPSGGQGWASARNWIAQRRYNGALLRSAILGCLPLESDGTGGCPHRGHLLHLSATKRHLGTCHRPQACATAPRWSSLLLVSQKCSRALDLLRPTLHQGCRLSRRPCTKQEHGWPFLSFRVLWRVREEALCLVWREGEA